MVNASSCSSQGSRAAGRWRWRSLPECCVRSVEFAELSCTQTRVRVPNTLTSALSESLSGSESQCGSATEPLTPPVLHSSTAPTLCRCRPPSMPQPHPEHGPCHLRCSLTASHLVVFQPSAYHVLLSFSASARVPSSFRSHPVCPPSLLHPTSCDGQQPARHRPSPLHRLPARPPTPRLALSPCRARRGHLPIQLRRHVRPSRRWQ